MDAGSGSRHHRGGGHGQGAAAEQLGDPTDVAVRRARRRFRADNINSRVQEWKPGAAMASPWPAAMAKGREHQLNRPIGVGWTRMAMSSSPRMGTLACRNGRGSGSGITVAGGHGQGARPSTEPTVRVALDSHNDIFVATRSTSGCRNDAGSGPGRSPWPVATVRWRPTN